jgi:hypothetical protein
MPETEDDVIADEPDVDDHDESESSDVVVDSKTEDTDDGS